MEDPETGMADTQRQLQVICQFRRHRSVQMPANTEYGAIARQDGSKPALQPIKNGFEAEKRACSAANGLLVFGKRSGSTRDASHTRICEMGRHPAKNVWPDVRVGIREEQHLPARQLRQAVQRPPLTAPLLHSHQRHPRVQDATYNLIRAVFRRIRSHKDIEQLRRIIPRQGLGNLPSNILLFVAGGDEHRDGGQEIVPPLRTDSRNQPDQPKEDWVSSIGVCDPDHPGPERYQCQIVHRAVPFR